MQSGLRSHQGLVCGAQCSEIWLPMKPYQEGAVVGGGGRKKLVIPKLKDSNPTGESFSSAGIRQTRKAREYSQKCCLEQVMVPRLQPGLSREEGGLD